MKKIVLAATVFAVIAISKAQEKPKGEHHLFDDQNAKYWRAFNGKELPAQWAFRGGVLVCEGKSSDKSDMSGDIVFSRYAFEDFELTVEWKIKKGSNSGIFYHIVEGEKYKTPYQTAPEYQIIDQVGFPEKLEPWQSIAADYAMYDPDYKGTLKEVGTWNTTKIVFRKDKVQYWLNGKKTVEFVPWSKDWEARKKQGKWKDYPDYGTSKVGLIGLQNHGDYVEYRSFSIKKL